MWSGFYNKPLTERQHLLQLTHPHLFPAYAGCLAPTLADMASHLQTANLTIENCIGLLPLPLGLALNFVVNGQPQPPIPMAIQEPSVIAACSSAAKWIADLSVHGFHTSTHGSHNDAKLVPSSIKKLVDGQILVRFHSESALKHALDALTANHALLLQDASSHCPRLRQVYGGGVDSISWRQLDARRLVLLVTVDVVEAMGANIINSILECMKPLVERLTLGQVVMSIVSNLSTHLLSYASFRIPISRMDYKRVKGADLADLLMEAYTWAQLDPQRAATHNKGVMNGIDAAAIALGQDWRAISAACYTWLQTRKHVQASMTRYWIEEHDDSPERYFCGCLELPLMGVVASRSTLIQTHPIYHLTHGLLSSSSSSTLSSTQIAELLCCVGLAQNLAALRALVTDGIQRGHMALHARSVALSAGAPAEVAGEVADYMCQLGPGCVHVDVARMYLEAHEIHQASTRSMQGETRSGEQSGGRVQQPSMLIFHSETTPSPVGSSVLPEKQDVIRFNVAFPSLLAQPMVLRLTAESNLGAFALELLGHKTHKWVLSMLALLQKGTSRLTKSWVMHVNDVDNAAMASSEEVKKRTVDVALLVKLKVISILMNVILRRVCMRHQAHLRKFIELLESEWGVIMSILERRKRKSSNVDGEGRLSQQLHRQQLTTFLRDFVKTLVPSLDSDDDARFLSVGLPLVFALWQVFEFHVDQWTVVDELRDALIMSQRGIIRHIVTAPSLALNTESERESGTWVDLAEYVKYYRCRFSLGHFLLIDAIPLDPSAVTPKFLENMKALGEYLDLNVVMAHDLDRSARDYAGLVSSASANGRVENSFIKYLIITHQESLDKLEIEPDFGNRSDEISRSEFEKRWHSEIRTKFGRDFVDFLIKNLKVDRRQKDEESSVSEAVGTIWSWYRVEMFNSLSK